MKFEQPKSCQEIAQVLNGRIVGSTSNLIFCLNRIEYAKEGDLTFFADKRYLKYLSQSSATCVLVPIGFNLLQPKQGQVFIEVENPYLSFFQLLIQNDTYYKQFSSFKHPSAIIEGNTKIADTAYIGANVVIGKNCEIGENTIILPNTTLYDNVKIGKNCLIHSNVVCYYNTVIGDNCIIHAGAVIGSDGFGFIENKDGTYTKIPQLGNVVIGNNVEIGANTTIDRAIVGSTIIEDGVKIDNLVQIAHNVQIGENTAMAAQVGISGSTKIGRRNRIAGQVGIAGHIEIADDVTLEAKSGVPKSITESGVYFGAPPKKKIEAFKILMATNELPELLQEFNKLKRILKDKFGIDI
ncbi:MAG: UDP-3-O-(3-hydroxymyristoyl)glucosamine N-acyltransferase [Ignavibacteria bacterium]|nr:UDP-3-O-(3-hydroxymyristoyl)glucosamine N-acyltransferase [Ignavibacteria bacterium]